MLRNRLIALVILLLSLIWISFSGGPVSYGFFFLTLITPVISVVYSLIILFRFRIYQELETKAVVAGTPTGFYYTLQNEDPVAHAGIRTAFFSDFSMINGLDSNTEVELLPHTGVSVKTQLICRYRGEYEVGIRSVVVTDYLRLFSLTARNRETLRVTVLPRLEMLEEIGCLDELVNASANAGASETEPDVLVREYLPGDDLRSVNWKTTARIGKPMVRKRIGEETPGVCILLDSCRYSDEPKTYLPMENKLLETMLSVTSYYLDRGIRVGAYACDRGLSRYTLEGTGSFEDFYQAMARFRFREESSQEILFREASSEAELYTGKAVILVLHEWSKAVGVFVGQLERYSVPVLACLVTDDQEEIPDTTDLHRLSFRVIGYDERLTEALK